MARERHWRDYPDQDRVPESYEDVMRRDRPSAPPRWWRDQNQRAALDFGDEYGTDYRGMRAGHYGDPSPISHSVGLGSGTQPYRPYYQRPFHRDIEHDDPSYGSDDHASGIYGDDFASWRSRANPDRRALFGGHRGKGPRGYVRSDDRILEDVNDRLTQDERIDASDIEVSVKDGEVTLTGTVSGRFEKRIAEDCSDTVSGVRNTQNNLRVAQAARD